MATKEHKDRREYHREYYRKNSEKLAERKQIERDRFERCLSYFRQKKVCRRETPGLLAGCSSGLIERARLEYERLLKEPVEVVTLCDVSTKSKRPIYKKKEE